LKYILRNDTPAEHELIRKSALANGAFDAVIASHWSDGGAGAKNLASALIKACETVDSQFKFLYDLESSIEEKILKIAQEMYGAANVEFNEKVKLAIKLYTEKVGNEIFLNFLINYNFLLSARVSINYQFVWRRHQVP
jgi:formyltetrahydrofolate synthetase